MASRATFLNGVNRSFSMLTGRLPEEAGPIEEVPHDRPKGLSGYFGQIPMDHHDEIETLHHPASVEAEILPHSSLDAIPSHGAPQAACNGQAQTLSRSLPPAHKQAKAFRGDLLPAMDDSSELARGADPIHLRKGISHLPPRQIVSH
jgi:hypothetical protein